MPFAHRQGSGLSDFLFSARFLVYNQLCISSLVTEKYPKKLYWRFQCCVSFVVECNDARIVKICRIDEYQIVPNSWDKLFANTNPNTNSKYWKEVWTLLPKKNLFLPSATLSSHPKKCLCPMRPWTLMASNSSQQPTPAYPSFHDFLAEFFLLFVISINFLFGFKFSTENQVVQNNKKLLNSAE